MVLSGSSLIRIEDVLQQAPGTWFQAYLGRNPEDSAALVERVKATGAPVLVVTVDSAIVPNRENNVRNRFTTPLRPSLRLLWDGMTHPRWALGTFLRTLLLHGMPHFENAIAQRGAPLVARDVARDHAGREHLDWEALKDIRRRWAGPLVLKGVLHPDDVRLARAAGVDGVIASNHGGRQLDGAAAPLHVLPQIADVAGPMVVMADSGFRRGTDVLKALALGARAVLIGRPMNYAAAVAGEAGVAHAIALLRAEIHADMGLLGINCLDELGPQFLMRRCAEAVGATAIA
jgi:L-lactate dehydrogenase (cytochrome)